MTAAAPTLTKGVSWRDFWLPKGAREARTDLADCLDDLRELEMLEYAFDNPNFDRIVDYPVWRDRILGQIRAIKDRWGIK